MSFMFSSIMCDHKRMTYTACFKILNETEKLREIITVNFYIRDENICSSSQKIFDIVMCIY